MPLSDYQNVIQTTPNSCGAFALAAALIQLGKAQIPNQLNITGLTGGFDVPAPQALAQSIYQSTGCLYLNSFTASYRFLAPVSDMNPPSAIVNVANRYKVPPSQIKVHYNNQANNIFQHIQVTNPPNGSLLETEINLITSEHICVCGPVDYLQPPICNQVHLMLVNDNTHWIAITKNEMYDPGTGFVGPYTINPQPPMPLTTIQGNSITYTFSGLWIILSN